MTNKKLKKLKTESKRTVINEKSSLKEKHKDKSLKSVLVTFSNRYRPNIVKPVSSSGPIL